MIRRLRQRRDTIEDTEDACTIERARKSHGKRQRVACDSWSGWKARIRSLMPGAAQGNS